VPKKVASLIWNFFQNFIEREQMEQEKGSSVKLQIKWGRQKLEMDFDPRDDYETFKGNFLEQI
jgi:hypothetical protein